MYKDLRPCLGQIKSTPFEIDGEKNLKNGSDEKKTVSELIPKPYHIALQIIIRRICP